MTYRLRPWHPDDDAYLIEHHDDSLEDVAKVLKRTLNAVRIRRHQLINRKVIERTKPVEPEFPTQEQIRERAAKIKAANLAKLKAEKGPYWPAQNDESE